MNNDCFEVNWTSVGYGGFGSVFAILLEVILRLEAGTHASRHMGKLSEDRFFYSLVAASCSCLCRTIGWNEIGPVRRTFAAILWILVFTFLYYLTDALGVSGIYVLRHV